METKIKKNQTAKVGEKYSYKYVDIAQIHEYLEANDMKYYQEVETNQINGFDYIMTYRFINGEWEEKPKRGCRVVDATLIGNNNPAQQQGSALTYARRYSLLMAFGLATEDDDAQSLNEVKEEPKATEKQKEMIKNLYETDDIKLELIALKKQKLSELTIKEASDLISKKKEGLNNE